MEIAARVHRLWEEEVLPTLRSYAAIPCLSPDFDPAWESTGHLHDAAELLAGWCRKRQVPGLEVEVVAPRGRTPIVLAQAPPAGGGRGNVLVYGHLDKQPALGDWRPGLGPFTPVREGELLYGRGTADDGYAAFCALSALEVLAASGGPRPGVVVLIEASEESGSPDLPAHLDALAGSLERPDLVVCLDSSCLTYDRLWLTSSLRGNVVLSVTVQVLTEGVHSGSAGGVVPTSFRLLRRLLDRLEDAETGEVRPAELRAEVPASLRPDGPVPWEGASVFPVVPGLQLAGSSEAERLLRRAWSPSVTVTGMDGLPPVVDGGNVLRPSTTAKLSLRLPPTVDAVAAAHAVETLLTADPPEGAAVTVHLDTPATGWVAPELVGWAAEAFHRASTETFGQPPGSMGEGGTIPFLAMLGERYPGVPFVATGVLGPGSNAHGPNEFLHLPMAEAVTVAVTRLYAAAAESAPSAGAGGAGGAGGDGASAGSR